MSDMDSKRQQDDALAKLIAGAKLDDKTGKMLTEDGRDLAAVMLGRRGGLKGGNARAASMSAERRSEVARLAAKKRWSKGNIDND